MDVGGEDVGGEDVGGLVDELELPPPPVEGGGM